MTPKQRSLLAGIQQKLSSFRYHHRCLSRQLDKLADSLTEEGRQRSDFSQEEIDKLLYLNRHLQTLQDYLLQVGKEQAALLEPRVADPTDPLDDFEIDATLYFTLREDDPDFDEYDDNFLTQREISLKRASEGEQCWDLLSDWREPGTMDYLVQEPHCYLFHDLYDHSYGLEQPALTLSDCLRIGSIWVNVAVKHQSTLDVDSGDWLQPAPRNTGKPDGGTPT